MSRRLTLHLTARHNAALDRILGDEARHDNDQRRRAVEQLVLDGAREPEDRAGAQNTAAVEPPGAADGSAARIDKESTVRLIDRLKASRDRYRNLAVRAEAALLGVPVRDDYRTAASNARFGTRASRCPPRPIRADPWIERPPGVAAGEAGRPCSSCS